MGTGSSSSVFPHGAPHLKRGAPLSVSPWSWKTSQNDNRLGGSVSESQAGEQFVVVAPEKKKVILTDTNAKKKT